MIINFIISVKTEKKDLEFEEKYIERMVNEMDVVTLLRWKKAIDNRRLNQHQSRIEARALSKTPSDTVLVQIGINDLSLDSFEMWKKAIYLRIQKDEVAELRFPSVKR